MPVGFKNTTEGNVQAAVDAVLAARRSHWFPSVTKGSVSAIFQTTGNEDCHVILRGGSRYGPNYDAESVAKAAEMLRVNGLPTKLMVDCSHGNSHKDFRRQSVVLQSIMDQLRSGSNYILGVMLESNLIEGRQDEPETYGQSITDSCLGWDETERLLEQLAEVVA
jgi:3-deoxy-7-phosphoheptulonate synthase